MMNEVEPVPVNHFFLHLGHPCLQQDEIQVNDLNLKVDEMFVKTFSVIRWLTHGTPYRKKFFIANR